jgi:hypothetical protein
MRTVIIRDDDTNALTPVECLERLYRPFLARGLPVNLATIPEVRTDVRLPNGRLEGFLPQRPSSSLGATVPLAVNAELTAYLSANPGYCVVQHGCYHDHFEFDRSDRGEVIRRLELGARRLAEAGFSDVTSFVAPHDKLSRVAYEEVVRRFRVLSTGWFEWRRVPRAWWPLYVAKKFLGRKHWRVGQTRLLSHPGCLLSYTRPLDTMLETIKQAVESQKVTVLVTHWWEYFRNQGQPDEAFIAVLHQTAEWLAARSDIRVLSFDTLARGGGAQREIRAAPLPAPMSAA